MCRSMRINIASTIGDGVSWITSLFQVIYALYRVSLYQDLTTIKEIRDSCFQKQEAQACCACCKLFVPFAATISKHVMAIVDVPLDLFFATSMPRVDFVWSMVYESLHYVL